MAVDCCVCGTLLWATVMCVYGPLFWAIVSTLLVCWINHIWSLLTHLSVLLLSGVETVFWRTHSNLSGLWLTWLHIRSILVFQPISFLVLMQHPLFLVPLAAGLIFSKIWNNHYPSQQSIRSHNWCLTWKYYPLWHWENSYTHRFVAEPSLFTSPDLVGILSTLRGSQFSGFPPISYIWFCRLVSTSLWLFFPFCNFLVELIMVT